MENAYMKPGPGGTGAIELNENGAFFQQTAYVGKPIPGLPNPQAPIGVGSYSGNTLGAQILLLFHEFAHIEKLIKPDNSADPAQALDASSGNTGKIEEKCKTAITEAIKSF